MPKEYTKEQLWKVFEKLPDELKEAVFSQETADNIWSVCEKNNVDEVSKIAKLVGDVLLGILPSEDFQITLEKESNLEKDIAKKVAQEINRFIFYPVKPSLEQLYKIGASPVEETSAKSATGKPTLGRQEETKITEQKSETSSAKDSYRETVE